jgi:hypothetical protein
MAEMTEEQKQDAAARAERERQEAATAQPPAQPTTAGSGTQLIGETPEEMKARLNEEAKQLRLAKEASDARTRQLEAEMAAMRAAAEEAKKEAERAEMTAIEKAQAERDDLEKQLSEERIARNSLALEQAATQLASEIGFRNPVLAAKSIELDSVVKDGKIDMGLLATEMNDLAQKNDYMLTKPPPAAQVGPTNNPPNTPPAVLAPSSVNLRAGADPRMALMEQKKKALDSMRDGRDPNAARNFVDAAMKHRATNLDAVYGTMYRQQDGNIPLKERGG